MPPRPKSLYLVHGWKVGIHERNVVLFEKGEDAMALGISLTVSADGRNYFVGYLLGIMDASELQDYAECAVPGADTEAVLSEKMEKLGVKQPGSPKLYMIAS